MVDRKIVIVDDEPIIRKSLEMVLQKHGYDVISVKNGEKALDLIHDEGTSVFIIDLGLPGIDGRDLAHRIIKENPLTKIILLTGSNISDADQLTKDQGIFELLYKPVDIDLLLVSVQDALQSS